MNERDPTRREFLLRLACGTAYAAPAVATFAVAPDLLAQTGSPPGHMHHQHGMPSPPSETSPTPPAPSERHPPPSKKE